VLKRISIWQLTVTSGNMDDFKNGVDYYMEGSRMVLTEHYLDKTRKRCCGNGCRHCCFEPTNEKGNVIKAKKDRTDQD